MGRDRRCFRPDKRVELAQTDHLWCDSKHRKDAKKEHNRRQRNYNRLVVRRELESRA